MSPRGRSEKAPFCVVDRSKHRSVYRGKRDRVDAYARPRWWCCSPHQLTLLLPLFNHQFSGASNQLRTKHLSSGLRATIYQHCERLHCRSYTKPLGEARTPLMAKRTALRRLLQQLKSLFECLRQTTFAKWTTVGNFNQK